MPVGLRLRPISSRLTIRMPVSLRLRPISSQLTNRMPASPRRSRISRSQRRISRKARQFPTGPEPEVVQEEVKRPPLYYFEEVEEKRARERELLASVSANS